MSPTYIQRLTPHGLQNVPYTAESLTDAARYEPDGIYTVTNTYDTFKVLKFDSHLDRMEDSAHRENTPLTLDRQRLRQALRQMIAQADFGDVRFRITVPHNEPDTFIITLEPFNPPSASIINAGVRCITVTGLMRRNPEAKTSDWMIHRSQHPLPEGIYEGLLLNDEGAILEGYGSNFYAIVNNELRTAGAGVLPGIAQQIIFTVAPPILLLHKVAIHRDDLERISEAFITSSSRGVIPVIEIDDIRIGDGTPGTRTMAIRRAYNRWVSDHLEEL